MKFEWRSIWLSLNRLWRLVRAAKCKLRGHRWSGWHRDIHTQEQVRTCLRCEKADWR